MLDEDDEILQALAENFGDIFDFINGSGVNIFLSILGSLCLIPCKKIY